MLNYNKSWGFHWTQERKLDISNFKGNYQERYYQDFELQIGKLIFWIFRVKDAKQTS